MYVRGCDPEWQFIYEDDLARLDVTLVKERKSGVFNAGAEGSVTYREMLGFTGKPSLGLPAWLWKPLISIGWKLHIQRKSQAGGLEFMRYPIMVSTEKLAKTSNFKFTMNSRDALKSFMDANKVGGKAAKPAKAAKAA
jgi:UDP-glucose 4-epimerase